MAGPSLKDKAGGSNTKQPRAQELDRLDQLDLNKLVLIFDPPQLQQRQGE
jgi:hypothetical protein